MSLSSNSTAFVPKHLRSNIWEPTMRGWNNNANYKRSLNNFNSTSGNNLLREIQRNRNNRNVNNSFRPYNANKNMNNAFFGPNAKSRKNRKSRKSRKNRKTRKNRKNRK